MVKHINAAITKDEEVEASVMQMNDEILKLRTERGYIK